MTYLLILFALFSIKNFVVQDNFCNFATWIERTCKPFDKGKLTAFPLFSFSQQNLKMSAMLKFEELPNVKSERWLDTKDLIGEVWKDAFENGFYQVSNYGRFKSVKRIVQNHNGNHVLKERIMKPCVTKKGYLAHSMRPYGKSMTKTIHILVWEAFYGKVPEGYEINHIDENKFNNTLENLNILKHKDNINWGTHNARMAKTLSKTHRLARKVEQIKDGKVVDTFCSIAECERQTGIKHQPISACCLGKRKTYKGYEWRFIE